MTWRTPSPAAQLAAELVQRLCDRDAVPPALVIAVDPLELAAAALRYLSLPRMPGAERALAVFPSWSAEPAGSGTPARGDQVQVASFVRAMFDDDPAVIELADRVDTLAVAYLCVAALASPPVVSQVREWLDVYGLAPLDPLSA